MSRHYTTLTQSTDPGLRRSTYIHRVADEVPPPAPMPVTAQETRGLWRGVSWALAVSLPFWAIALGATIVAVLGGVK